MIQFPTKSRSVLGHRKDISQQPMVSATENPLEKAMDVLDKASALAKKVAPPINSTTNGLKHVVDVVDELETVIKDLNEMVKIANVIADLGFALTEIPIVGEVTDALASGIRSFTETIDTILVPLNTFKAEVLDEVKSVIGKIYDVCKKIDGYVTYFATK